MAGGGLTLGALNLQHTLHHRLKTRDGVLAQMAAVAVGHERAAAVTAAREAALDRLDEASVLGDGVGEVAFGKILDREALQTVAEGYGETDGH